jgi:hypothetical protein
LVFAFIIYIYNKMSQAAIIGVIALMMMSSSSSVAILMMGGGPEEGEKCTPKGTKKANATYKYNSDGECTMYCNTGYTNKSDACVKSPPTDPCAGLTYDSLASSVSVECLRKILTDEGCTDQGTVWPADDYDGWWRQSPQGTTTVYCDNQGTPCGAGNYATVKSDIHAWATMTDALHVAGCGRAT